MDILSLPDLLKPGVWDELSGSAVFPSVSLYLPMVKAGREVRENIARFKNGWRQAQKQLEELDVMNPNWEDRFQELAELSNDLKFWENQEEGLVVFLWEDMTRIYKLPLPFAEISIVSDRFHLKPLLPLFAQGERFFVLAVSQKRVNFYQAGRFYFQEIQVPKLPHSIYEIFGGVEVEQSVQMHTVSTGAGTRAITHGQYSLKEDQKEDIQKYLREIDRALRPFLARQQAPMLLAADAYYLPLYREITDYKHLLDDILPGRVDRVSEVKLHREAWEKLAPYFQEQVAVVRRQVEGLAGQSPGLVAKDISTVLSKATDRAVETLFLAIETNRWGWYNQEIRVMVADERYEAGDYDLLDLAARLVLGSGGQVYSLSKDQMPLGVEVAAVLRY